MVSHYELARGGLSAAGLVELAVAFVSDVYVISDVERPVAEVVCTVNASALVEVTDIEILSHRVCSAGLIEQTRTDQRQLRIAVADVHVGVAVEDARGAQVIGPVSNARVQRTHADYQLVLNGVHPVALREHTDGACAHHLVAGNVQRSAGHLVASRAGEGVVGPDV